MAPDDILIDNRGHRWKLTEAASVDETALPMTARVTPENEANEEKGYTMTPLVRNLLARASECEEGKGFMLNPAENRIAAAAVKVGHAEVWQAGMLRVFVITDAGRAALAASDGRIE